MDPIKAKIIFEISTLCLIGIIIGLFVFWLYRIKPKKNALYTNRYVPENKKEIIDPVIKIDLFDLMIVITIILFFYANVALLYFETNNVGPSESSKAKVELSLNETLLSVGIFLIVGAVIFSLASISRGRHPRQVFGLRRRSPLCDQDGSFRNDCSLRISIYWFSYFKYLIINRRTKKRGLTRNCSNPINQ